MEDDEPTGLSPAEELELLRLRLVSREHDLSPAEELELLRRREAEAEQERHARINAYLRDPIHKENLPRSRAEAAGLAQPNDLLPTLAMIEAKHAELEAAKKPCGIRAIAVALDSSPTVVHKRLGGQKIGTSEHVAEHHRHTAASG